MKKNSGITLIALIITIIIMLILAGVTISILGGEDGLISKAETAVNKFEQARKDEEQQLKEVEAIMVGITTPWNGRAATAFASGEGTEESPYIISSGEELAYFAEQVNSGNKFTGKYIEIAESINLNNRKFTPIGLGNSGALNEGEWSFPNTFDGNLNGNGNIITGINIEELESHGVGFIGVVGETGVVENINIYNGTVKGKASVGGVVGVNSGIVRNCINKATIIAQDNETEENSGNMAGGIVGWFEKGVVENCTNYGSVTTKNDSATTKGKMAGGIVGAATSNYSTGTADIEIRKCVNNGEVNSAGINAGGIVGYVAAVYRDVVIENCTNTGNVTTATSQAGGIAARLALGNAEILHCENSGDIFVGKTYGGGIIGMQQTGNVSNCVNNGKVESTETAQAATIGGISGYIGNGTIDGCTNNGNVIAKSYYVGGITGYQTDGEATELVLISNCKNTGGIAGVQNVGGVAGRFKGNVKILSCVNSGTIKSDKDQVGGIAGSQEGGVVEKVSNTGDIMAGVNAEAVKRRTAGGIIGTQWSGDLSEAYNAGKVTVESDTDGQLDVVGGIVGYQFVEGNGSNVIKTYNKGALGTTDIVGAIVGQKKLAGNIAKSYYYTEGTIKGIGSESDDITVQAPVNDTAGKTEKVTDNIANYDNFLTWIAGK